MENEKIYEEYNRRGFVGIGIYNGKFHQNIGSLFRSATQLGCDFVFTIGERYMHQKTDTMKCGRHIPIFNFKDWADFREHLPNNCETVGVEMCDRAIPLESHTPFSRVCYLLGAEDHGLPQEAIKSCRKIVKLPGNISMNVACAGSIILYNHFIKTQRHVYNT